MAKINPPSSTWRVSFNSYISKYQASYLRDGLCVEMMTEIIANFRTPCMKNEMLFSAKDSNKLKGEL